MDEATVYQRRWLALGVLALSLVIIGMDNTILNVALPHLSEDLNASNSQLQWIVDGYVIVFAGLILTMGSLGDRFGRKGFLQLGLVVFVAGSIAAALAQTSAMLITFRMIMGVGGAMIMPATLSLLTNIFHDPTERGRAIGVWAGVAASGIVFGPILGGVLLAHFWWGSVFLINIPVCVAALVSGHYLLPRSKDPKSPRIDPIGALLSIVALVTVLWGLIEAPSWGWTAPGILGAFAVGLALMGAFVAWELHSDHPMLEMRFFKNRRFTAANAGITMVFFAMFGSSFVITQQLQFVMGYSPLKAGLAMTPIAVPLLILGPLSARIVERVGTKAVVGSGLVLAAVGLAWMSRLTLGSDYWDLVFPMLVLASGMGLTMAPATESVMGAIPREKAGVGSAMNDTTRQVGGALGVAVIGSVLASVYRPNVLTNLHATVLGTTAAGGGANAGQAQAAIDAIHQQLGAAFEVAKHLPGGADGALGRSVIRAAQSAFVDGFGGALLVGAAVALFGAAIVFAYLPAHGDDDAAAGIGEEHGEAGDLSNGEPTGLDLGDRGSDGDVVSSGEVDGDPRDPGLLKLEQP
ncbi:MAG TPA: MFS transporter [Acidimicrobiales bacterium]|nr:MFS transporter [Acidimicrobiales bacterium]